MTVITQPPGSSLEQRLQRRPTLDDWRNYAQQLELAVAGYRKLLRDRGEAVVAIVTATPTVEIEIKGKKGK